MDLNITWSGLLCDYIVSKSKYVISDNSTITVPFDGIHKNEELTARIENGRINGIAIIRDINKCKIWELSVVNNEISGPFKRFSNNVLIAEGLLKDSKREGKVIEYINGKRVFEGIYTDDKRNGHGYEYSPSQQVMYNGEYKDGVRITSSYYVTIDSTDYLCVLNPQSDTVYRGEADGDKSVLKGKCVEVDFSNNPRRTVMMDNGHVIGLLGLFSKETMLLYDEMHRICYEGGYTSDGKNGYLRSGWGRAFVDSKRVYEGLFENDECHGDGVCYYGSGGVLYEGKWENGKANGIGRMYTPIGVTICEGRWRNNELHAIDRVVSIESLVCTGECVNEVMAIEEITEEIESFDYYQYVDDMKSCCVENCSVIDTYVKQYVTESIDNSDDEDGHPEPIVQPPQEPQESQESQESKQPQQPTTPLSPKPIDTEVPHPVKPSISEYHDQDNDQYYIGVLYNNKINGNGRILYSDRSVFKEGTFIQNQLVNEGCIYYKMSDVNEYYKEIGREATDHSIIHYKGDFDNDALDGEGEEHTMDGTLIYQGEFQDNQYCGKGVFYDYNNDSYYKGSFDKGEMCGEGAKYRISDDSLFEEGHYKKGLLNGNGKVYKDGHMKYEGEFENGMMCGEGRLYDDNDRIVYEGMFSNDEMNGIGVLNDYANNIKRCGFMINGMLNGRGERRIRDIDFTLEKGQFMNDELVKGRKYNRVTGHIMVDGSFIHGALHKRCCVYDDNGCKSCEGIFSNNHYNGYFTFYVNGKPHKKGNLHDDKWNGIVVEYYPNGREQSVSSYKNNVKMGTSKEYHENGQIMFVGEYDNMSRVSGKEYLDNGDIEYEGSYQNNQYYNGVLYFCYDNDNSKLCIKREIKEGVIMQTMQIYVTDHMKKHTLDDDWWLYYEGGFVNDEFDIPIKHGKGTYHNHINKKTIDVEYNNGELLNQSFQVWGNSKNSLYMGNVVFDDNEGVFWYQGKGRYVYRDNSYFEGDWERGVLQQTKNVIIFWGNGRDVKYNCPLIEVSVNDPNAKFDYLPSGNVYYYPLNSELVFCGIYSREYNCLLNPITVLKKTDNSIIYQGMVRYQMSNDGFNVIYNLN